MRHVTLHTLVAAIVVLAVDLLHPGRTRRARLVTPEATIVAEFDELDLRIVGVGLADAVTGFATDGFVRPLEQFVMNVFMTLQTGFAPGEYRRVRGVFRQRITPIEAVLAERRWREEIPGDDI